VSSCQERLVENQHTFRNANERLQELVENRVTDLATIPFLCECADLECRGRIELTTSDYEAAHIFDNRYVILAGHLQADGEQLVSADGDGYLVVEKTP
jgi:hypothetical protein